MLILYLQELYKGEDKPCTVSFSEENKLLNRFKNIATCMCMGYTVNINIIITEQMMTTELSSYLIQNWINVKENISMLVI